MDFVRFVVPFIFEFRLWRVLSRIDQTPASKLVTVDLDTFPRACRQALSDACIGKSPKNNFQLNVEPAATTVAIEG